MNKICTSLEQSKVLSKILPLKSADLWYAEIYEGKIEGYNYIVSDTPYYSISFTKPSENNYSQNTVKDIPCWSLAALISIIPQELFGEEYIINITEGCDNKWILTYDHHENKNHSYYGLSTSADNLVDACTDIIIKLKERNII